MEENISMVLKTNVLFYKGRNERARARLDSAFLYNERVIGVLEQR
jgi:hypothetical protein